MSDDPTITRIRNARHKISEHYHHDVAQLIAHYGEIIKSKLSQLKPENMQTMSDLVARRNQLLVMQTMEINAFKYC